MEQRPLRLGDIVDDYCPRERRITNHAIVAIVEDAIRQTRCATCDTEHVYKQGKEPLRRRKDAPASALAEDGSAPLPPDPIPVALPESPTLAAEPLAAQSPEPVSTESPEPSAEAPRHDDHWPAHRQLIRASLPKIEGDVPAPRPIPEFTMYQRPVGRGGFRFRNGRPGNGDGNVAGRGDFNGRGGYGNGNPNGNVNGNGDGNRAGQGRSRRRRSHGKRSG